MASNPAYIRQVLALGQVALVWAETSWGSEAQIEVENAFVNAAKAIMTPEQVSAWDAYSLKATSEEIIRWALDTLSAV